MSCRTVRSVLHRDNATLDESERILLEEHLEGCATCRRARDQLALAREAAHSLPLEPLGTAAHQRVLAQALLQRREPARAPRWRVGRAVVAGAAACAVVTFIVLTREGVAPHQPDVATPSPSALDAGTQPGAQVVAGQLIADRGVVTVGDPLPLGASVTAVVETRIALRATTLVLDADTAIRYVLDEHAIVMERGALDVEVDPTARKRVRVITEHFTVEVTGTVFRVTPSQVSVTRGSVRILAADGDVLVVALTAGETWSFAAKIPALASAAEWIERSLRAFTARDYKTAERYAEAALDAGPTRAQAAEARTIAAECAQALGRLDEAVRRYDVIATRFADLPAGETAAIAAARIERGRGHVAAARERFRSYLERHPHGRFVDDARRQLEGMQR